MLKRILSWFAPKQPEQSTAPEIPDEALFLSDKEGKAGGPHLHGLARDYGDVMKACDIAKCQRPSSFDVVTLQHLTVDVPFTRRNRDAKIPRREKIGDDFIETQSSPLPTYQFYALCDRHYEAFVRGKAPNGQSTKLVIGPQVRYKVDEEGARV